MAKNTKRNDRLSRTVKFVRVFTVAAMLVGGGLEFWSSSLFTTPVEQIGFATIAGVLAAVVAKSIQLV